MTMNYTASITLALLLSLSLSACGGGDAVHEGHNNGGAAEAAPVAASTSAVDMIDGVQVVTLTAGPLGYDPKEITLQADVPARFVVTRTDPNSCLERINLAEFDLELIDLPLNEAVSIEFTPTEAGTFTFVCGMDMQRGTVVVEA
ncbi:MAG: hypothetical protein RhofKO_36800 [Rhodothermales bacterium]